MKSKGIAAATLILGFALLLLGGCTTMSSYAPATSTGKSGSMARFTIAGEHMYAVSETTLHIFDLSQRSQPRLVATVEVGEGIETIFSYKDLLFFGTRLGMLIYSIEAPENPAFLSEYRHVYSCDPIVVEDGYAYVTLRSQAQCRTGRNELHIYDIKDPTAPLLIKSYTMGNPWGLGIDRKKLFVCDGRHGLKVFDANDPEQIELLETIESINGYDVIPNDRILIVSARDGIYQFDYSTHQLRKLSRIPVGY